MRKLYTNITRIAEAKRMTISEVEQAAGLEQGEIEKWKKYTPNLDAIFKVQAALHVDLTDLV